MASIWIDLDNAPHVPLFEPLISELQSRGHETLVTVRDHGYTREMLEQKGIPHSLVGRHPGKNPVRKVLGLMGRVLSLVRWARSRPIDVAVSHGSRALVLASAGLRIPCVTMYDYEFVSTAIYRYSSKVLVPDLLSGDAVRALRLARERVMGYPGLKEEVYLGSFVPDPSIKHTLDLPDDKVVVVVRPPATAAHYHNPDSEKILHAFLDRLRAEKNAIGVVVPRTHRQAFVLGRDAREAGNIRILTTPVNGLNLLWHSDLVVGGGGTMNREAALLGVPVYSVFKGRIGAIDRALAEQGRMVFLRDAADVADVKLERRGRGDFMAESARRKQRSGEIIGFVCDEILRMIRA